MTTGRYTQRALLGRGGMGEVYRAYDERLRRWVALKRIRPITEPAGDPPADDPKDRRRARLEREARLVAQLAHPAIVQVFDLFEDDAGDWVVMELVSGQTLAARLEGGPLAIDDAVACAIAIAEALEAAHRQGIVHRDLKVENVMRSTDGQIKVLDFGLAKHLPAPGDAVSTALSVDGQVIGTVRAMSPEQARGLAIDARSDLFSLGVLIYELVSGDSPFAGASPLDTLHRVAAHRQISLADRAELAGRVPGALSKLVDQLLEKPPALRPASARDVLSRLRALTSDSAPVSPSPARTDDTVDLPPPAAKIATAATADLDVDLALAPATAPPPRPRYRTGAWIALAALTIAAASLVLLCTAPATAPATSGDAELRDPRAAYDRGMALLRDFHRPGAIDQATAIFQRLLRDDERSAAGYAGLARADLRKYLFTDATRDPMFLGQAQAAGDRAVALDALFADARVSRGLVLLERGQPDAAEVDLRAALAVHPRSADAYDGLARLHLHRQALDAAEAAYRTAIDLAPRDRHLYDDLGGLQVQRGEYQAAIPLFQTSIALAPDSPYGYSNLGAVYLLQGRYDDAAARFQDALKIRPSASLYSNLGTVLYAQGLYAPSASAFERALAMGGAANHDLYWGNLADAYRQLPDAERARDAYGHAIALIDDELARAPGDLTLHSRRALYRAKRGECAAAEAELPELIAATHATAYTRFRVAVATEICGQRPRAIELLDRALAAGFSPAEIANDPELRALRADPAYHRRISPPSPR